MNRTSFKIAILFSIGLFLAGIFIVLVKDRADRRQWHQEEVAKEQAILKAEAEAEDRRQKDDVEQEKIELLKRIASAELAGRVTHEEAQRNRDILNGKIKLYHAPDGSITTNQNITITNGQ